MSNSYKATESLMDIEKIYSFRNPLLPNDKYIFQKLFFRLFVYNFNLFIDKIISIICNNIESNLIKTYKVIINGYLVYILL